MRCSVVWRAGFVIVLGWCWQAPARAFDWSSTNLQSLYGKGFILSEPEHATLTLEHADGWRYGDNFFFLDLVHHLGNRGVDLEAYGEWYGRLSLKKTTGQALPLPGIRDLSLNLSLNAGSKPKADPFKAYLAGVGVDLDVPGFDYLQLGFYAYRADGGPNTGLQFTPVWNLPFSLAGQRFRFRGFFDLSSPGTTANGNWHFLAQPQLLLDVGAALSGHGDRWMLGIEWWLWLNKFGLQNQNESVPQVVLEYYF